MKDWGHSHPVRMGVLRPHGSSHCLSPWRCGWSRDILLGVREGVVFGTSSPPPPKVLTYHYCLCAGVSSSRGGVVCGDLSVTRTSGVRSYGVGACGSSCKKCWGGRTWGGTQAPAHLTLSEPPSWPICPTLPCAARHSDSPSLLSTSQFLCGNPLLPSLSPACLRLRESAGRSDPWM